ncbi:LysR family transcriptional regulator [Streptomyces sp. NBC_00234]|uniref:LysR family transcriptional regulator n=1 Tax=Streptomyces sp. NBC_00234 TaxID=2903638 RepID=UPI002E27EC8D|nr:LysR family transcriptional regulator [Streptomyces sp. NBC_00234]
MFDLRRSDVALLQAVSDHGSLHAVERGGRMTQSSASRRLIKLERRLRTPLVSRSSTGTELTEAGHALLHAGRRLVGAIDFAMATSHHRTDTEERLPVVQFAVGTERAYGMGRDLADRFPEAVFDVVPGDSRDVWQRFERYAVDAACGWETTRRPGLRRSEALVRTVVDEPQWVALPRDHPLARREALDLHDLADAEWVATVGGDACDDQGWAFSLLSPAPRVSFTVRSQSAALELVGRGYGVALVSPLSPEPEHELSLVLRPLRQRLVRRLSLAVDPLVVPLTLAHELCTWLRYGYAQRAAKRNPVYAASASFPPLTEGPGRPIRTRTEADISPSDADAPLPVLLSELHWAGPESDNHFEAEHLHLLRVIHRIGSLNRAAATLLVTQPALTRRIHRLEKGCGLPLVYSTARGTSLSAAARRLLDCTGPAESRLDELVGRMRQHAAAQSIGTPAAPRAAA